MRDYDGVKGDKPYGGGDWVRKHGYGAERFNFRPVRQRLFGYANNLGGRINLARLGALPSEDHVDDVTIIWSAPRKGYGQVVVGWYEHARVFRDPRHDPRLHFFEARSQNCKLLKTDERLLRVPRGDGAMGQNNVWYPDNVKGRRFIRAARQLMAGKSPKSPGQSRGGRAWQHDVEARLRIEQKAIRAVRKRFKALGYRIDDVQKKNKGWDLEAKRDSIVLRLEVKGLALKFQTVELTPNEFSAMKNHEGSFRLCVASGLDAAKARLQIYEYSPEAKRWLSQDDSLLNIAKVQSARCTPA